MKNIIATLGIIGVALLIFIGAYFVSQKKAEPVMLSPEQQALLAVAQDDYTIGPKNSKVVLVEYSDFECPACAAFHPIIKDLLKAHPEVLFVSRYFPLQGHKNGMTSALVVEAAGQQGKFWEMHDKVFETQKEWGGKNVADANLFREYAQELDLNMEQYVADMQSDAARARVQRDYDAGIKADVRGTPTFFLNGKQIEMPGSFEAFSQMLTDAGVTPTE